MTSVVTALPPELSAALAEMYRRAAAAAEAGRAESDAEPSLVVISDAVPSPSSGGGSTHPTGLHDPAIRAAVEKLAVLGRKVNMSVELRGTLSSPDIADFGGSRVLYAYAAGAPHVRYRCLRPLADYTENDLHPGTTRVVCTDPQLRAHGRADTGTFMGWPDDLDWARVKFDDQPKQSYVLARFLMVEVQPA